jgi:hypothetical protein
MGTGQVSFILVGLKDFLPHGTGGLMITTELFGLTTN